MQRSENGISGGEEGGLYDNRKLVGRADGRYMRPREPYIIPWGTEKHVGGATVAVVWVALVIRRFCF